MNEEDYLRQILADLYRSYEAAAKPYIDRLVRIKSTETPKWIIPLEALPAYEDAIELAGWHIWLGLKEYGDPTLVFVQLNVRTT